MAPFKLSPYVGSERQDFAAAGEPCTRRPGSRFTSETVASGGACGRTPGPQALQWGPPLFPLRNVSFQEKQGNLKRQAGSGPRLLPQTRRAPPTASLPRSRRSVPSDEWPRGTWPQTRRGARSKPTFRMSYVKIVRNIVFFFFFSHIVSIY